MLCVVRAPSRRKNTIKYHCCLDNIDTKTALDALRDLVSHCNLYLRDRKPPNAYLLQDIGIYITDMLKIFGAIVERKELKIGFPLSNDVTVDNVSTRHSSSPP